MNMRGPLRGMTLLVVPLALVGCPHGRSRQAEVLSDPPTSEVVGGSSPEAAPAAAVTHVNGAEGGSGEIHMTLTVADGEAIKVVLFAQLEKQRDLEDHDYLVTATRHARPTLDEGVMRVGSWILQLDGDKLELSLRMPGGRVAARMYTAVARREGNGWQVGEVQAGEVRWR